MVDIMITGVEAASNTNLLANSRIETIPNGARQLHFRCQASLADASNSYALTIELPSGLIPVDGQIVMADNPALGGVLDERTLMQWTWPAVVGGRFIISVVETGTAVFTWLVHLS